MDVGVEGVSPISWPKKTWCGAIEKDCQTHQICKKDAMECRKYRKLIKDVI